MGILDESKRARSGGLGFWRSRKFMIAILLLAAGGGVYAFWPDRDQSSAQGQAAEREFTARRGDIAIAVETNGQVVAEDGVELSFSVSGGNLAVKEVYVKEGDEVKRGDKIATAETKDLELNLNSAWISYQSSLADHNETMAGATDKQVADSKDKIAAAETSLVQSRLSLEETRQSAERSLLNAEKDVREAKERWDENRSVHDSEDVRDAYDSLVENIKSVEISLDAILRGSDEIIGVDKAYLNDNFEINLGAKAVGSLLYAQGTYKKARNGAAELNRLAVNLGRLSVYSDIDAAAELAVRVLADFEDHLNAMKTMLDATITTAQLSENSLNSYINSINSNRSSVISKLSALNTRTKAVADAKKKLDDYRESYEAAVRDLDKARADAERNIFNAEATVASRETSLAQAKRDYEELFRPLTEAQLASVRQRLNSASVSLQRARNSLDDATLTAPIDGRIVELNYKTGDIIVNNSRPLAVILNSDTLFVKVNVEEADVSKLSVGQKADAVFDALDGLKLEGEISFISLMSNTSNQGIVTYEVRVLIDNSAGHNVREGMTASIKFISAEAKDVLMIPVASVRNVAGKPSVRLKDGDWQAVVTGFTDGRYVEVIGGLGEGDIVVY